MSSQCFLLNMNSPPVQNMPGESQINKRTTTREKIMSYEEKSVGSTAFFQCEACPFMALAEDDIKFHLFTVHPDLAKTNGLADNIQIPCPGCNSIFDTEETLRNHLRHHHKMGFKDVKKMVKSLVQIALKNAILKKEVNTPEPLPPQPQVADVKMPQVIEIVPDVVNANTDPLPKGVAFISVDELNRMSTPNFEKVDPKDMIQEASINIVYTNEVSTQYVNVSELSTTTPRCSTRVTSVPPDLISSITPRVNYISGPTSAPRINCIAEAASVTPRVNCITEATARINCISEAAAVHPRINCIPEAVEPPPSTSKESMEPTKDTYSQCRKVTKKTYDEIELKQIEEEKNKKKGHKCAINNCDYRIKDEDKLVYHRKCHKDKGLQCPECSKTFNITESLHNHLWKVHDIDMDLPTCEICGYKTFKKYRLFTIHMKCHDIKKSYTCDICSKAFKNCNQLSKHKTIHKNISIPCPVCQKEFANKVQMKLHKAAVHDKLKPFKCSMCEYASAKKSDVKLHMRSHTGEKPYSCDQCNYRFSDHNSLRRHKKQHTKENPYKCKHCPYTAIQSTQFTSHMISTHPDVNKDVHRCPYCPFKTVSKDKYIVHLSKHTDKEGIKLLVEMIKEQHTNKPNWTIPTDKIKVNETEDEQISREQSKESSPKPLNKIPIEVFDCDSLSESMPQNYTKNYCPETIHDDQQTQFNNQIVTDLSKDGMNSDHSNGTLLDRHQFSSQHPLPMPYAANQSNLRGFLPSVTIQQDLIQNTNVCSLSSSHLPIANNMSNNIMANFPIRLPPSAPHISVRNNITLKPIDKFSLGPIIKPTQILPVPSSSNSPVSAYIEPEGAPRKKPKISVKSNLILKGPDQENMFHSQQKLAFKRLEDNERFGLGVPVTFNNLITTQFMQLQAEPVLSESPSDIMTYQEPMMGDATSTPVDNDINSNPQIFSFNQPINVNQMTLLPPPQKIQNNPSYIKIEAPIKQNTQSPSLERMCNANLLTNQGITREYKASPPLEDIHKNINEIKNEMKSDTYYSIALNNTATTVLDQFLMDNLIGEQYPGHMDLSSTALQEMTDDQQNDVIEIDDNSDDNKLLPRFDMNFPLESLYLMHNDFHFLENEVPANNLITSEVSANEMNRMVVNDMPIGNQREATDDNVEVLNNDHSTSMQGRKDPMMNTPIRPTVNKINVKNIELMKN